MTSIIGFLKKFWQGFQWVLYTLFVIVIYEKFVKGKQQPQTVVNNDNSTNTSVEVDKIKNTTGTNDLMAVSDPEVLKKKIDDRLTEIKAKQPVTEVKKVNPDKKSVNKKGKIKKVEKLIEKSDKAKAKGNVKKAGKLILKADRKGKKLPKQTV